MAGENTKLCPVCRKNLIKVNEYLCDECKNPIKESRMLVEKETKLPKGNKNKD
jgi:hypothetical protein